MEITNVHLLLIANFLHATASGLVVPSIPNHIVANGGNQFLLAILCSSLFVCNILARSLIGYFILTTKQYMTCCLFCSLISDLLLVLSHNPVIIWLDRSLYAFTNLFFWYSKEYVAVTQRGEGYMQYARESNILKTTGLVLGSISSGHMYDSRGFPNIALTTTTLTLSSFIVLLFVEADSPFRRRRRSTLPSLPQLWVEEVQCLLYCDYASMLQSVVLILVYTFTFTIFLGRHLLVTFPSATAIGYDLAIQIFLQSVCYELVPIIRAQFKSRKPLFRISLFVCAFSFSALLFGPHLFYWVFFALMLLTNTVINLLFEEDVLDLKWDTCLLDAVFTLQIIVKIAGPLVFVVLEAVFGETAMILLCVFPITAFVFLVSEWMKRLQEVNM